MRIAMCARASTKDAGQSTANQLPDLRRYAQVHAWNIYNRVSSSLLPLSKKGPFFGGFPNLPKRPPECRFFGAFFNTVY
jgi:hypothetical protein